jgi:hypothetical protein
VLATDPLFAAGQLGLGMSATKLVEAILVRHQGPSFIDFRSIFHQ